MNIQRTLESLDPDTRYSIRVRAISRFNVASDWSEVLEVDTPSSDYVSPGTLPLLLRVKFNGSVSGARYLAFEDSDTWPNENINHYLVENEE